VEISIGSVVCWHAFSLISGDLTIGIVEKKLRRNWFRIKVLFPEFTTSRMWGPRRKDFFLLSQIDSETWNMMKSNIACRIENLKKTLDFIEGQRR
jgi:hypothetical protein